MINRRTTLKMMGAAGALATLGGPLGAQAATGVHNADKGTRLQRILFGSCAHQDKDQPIWTPINAMNPDLFIFLGDNIYADTRDMDVMAEKYKKLARKQGFQDLIAKTPVIATWDDHDYGENDSGFDYPMKEPSKAQFLDFWDTPKSSPRRRADDGVYMSYEYGPADQRVQVILLDLRWNRTPLKAVSKAEAKRRDQMAFGPYLPQSGPGITMLGEKQWAWLEGELRKPAKVRIIGSSLQFISTFPGWEGWSLFPGERQRMIDLINRTGAEGVLFISGDTHWAEISLQDTHVPYPLYDFTSSGLTQTWYNMSPNVYRMPGCMYTDVNFGILEIDWNVPDPQIVMQARDVNGKPVFEKSILLSELSRR
ncbi:alkaline phosphatase D family protein [Kordiimonas marina]|uniref:alkaline phosphatase D family protein n=1 Tax=Kordiimonas marina TaxID=2872312 RepID=UPI001FF35720|nr:alkaline phosphatase D family protein [Kordiimonas marina]MCJ9428615.1 alkaline phosphatase D family protein [Kordiimonas marina]